MDKGLKLFEYIDVNRVLFKESVESKEDLIKELLASICTSNSVVCSHQEALYNTILDREKLRSTAMGKEVAIPHGRNAAMDDIYLAFARLDNEIIWDADEGVPVKYVFLVIGPAKEKAQEYLMLLAQISKLISRRSTREDLNKAGDAAAIIRVMQGLKERKKHLPNPPL